MKLQAVLIIAIVTTILSWHIGYVKEANENKRKKELALRMDVAPWVEDVFETQVVSTIHFVVFLPLKGSFDCFRFQDSEDNTFVHEVSVNSDEETMNSHRSFIRAVENYPFVTIRCLFKKEDSSKKKYIVEIKNIGGESLWTSTALKDFLSRK